MIKIGQCSDCCFEFRLLPSRRNGRWKQGERISRKHKHLAFYGGGVSDHCPNCNSKNIEKIEQLELIKV